ncbi:unnamed protein product [Litomosoides sigmodontis]|uniref:Uncharacterized protein n=1 Tax=Litomosoides sigmodontis TaxID=42156 RepID=A0A3P6SR49_LITSI|nr:unnamed protein product [Litomosoides sigmodontis]
MGTEDCLQPSVCVKSQREKSGWIDSELVSKEKVNREVEKADVKKSSYLHFLGMSGIDELVGGDSFLSATRYCWVINFDVVSYGTVKNASKVLVLFLQVE